MNEGQKSTSVSSSQGGSSSTGSSSSQGGSSSTGTSVTTSGSSYLTPDVDEGLVRRLEEESDEAQKVCDRIDEAIHQDDHIGTNE